MQAKSNVVLEVGVTHRIFINNLPKLKTFGIISSTMGTSPSFIITQVASSEFSLFKLIARYLSSGETLIRLIKVPEKPISSVLNKMRTFPLSVAF